MIGGMPGRGKTENLLNLFFTLAVMAIFLLACTSKQDGSVDTSKPSRIVELREEEHTAVKHPNKAIYAYIQPNGLQVSFKSNQAPIPRYTFEHKEFQLGETVFLLCPGLPDLLPMRVVLIKRSEDPNDYHVYKIEWLDKSPATAGGTRVVRSYQTDPQKDILR